MIRTTTDVSPAALAAHDAVIDVRSPGEFAEDHLPGAINLPVLTDVERVEVGTEYVQGSKFRARRRGAALVARNIVAHLEGALADRPAGFRPLVHCWRGGQRSHALATVMDQVGWPVTVLEGGYRTWRRAVVDALYDRPLGLTLILLDGPTGCGKTALLGQLSARGVQTLDLEALANHRGSLFGARTGGQPPQKLFESRLFAAIAALDPARPVVVEAESSKVGARVLPRSVWEAMTAAPSVEIDAPVEARAAYTVDAYAEIAADPDLVGLALSRLPRHLPRATVDGWRRLAAEGRMAALALDLIREHYDPAYRRAARPRAGPGLGRIAMPAVDADALGAAAAQVEGLLPRGNGAVPAGRP